MTKNYYNCRPEGYRTAGRLLWDGAKMLAEAVWHSIATHKMLTALIVSMVINITLMVALAKERVQRDNTSHLMYELEHENDSLKGTNYKIYQYHG